MTPISGLSFSPTAKLILCLKLSRYITLPMIFPGVTVITSFSLVAMCGSISNTRIDFVERSTLRERTRSFYAGRDSESTDAFQNYLDTNDLPGDEKAGESLSSQHGSAQCRWTRSLDDIRNCTHSLHSRRMVDLLAPGNSLNRDFASQAYDGYVQDTWKVRPSLTLTLGLRYGLERPVYERNGFEIQPTVPLGDYLRPRCCR